MRYREIKLRNYDDDDEKDISVLLSLCSPPVVLVLLGAG